MFTITLADCDAEPPGPVHVMPNVAVPADVGITDCVPPVAFAPDHVPAAVHEVAPVDDHVTVIG